jgi:hypothetical protein
MKWTIWGSIPSRGKRFFFLKHILSDSGAHPVYHSMGTGVLSSGIKLAQHEADHLPSFSVEVKNEWSYTSTLPA